MSAYSRSRTWGKVGGDPLEQNIRMAIEIAIGWREQAPRFYLKSPCLKVVNRAGDFLQKYQMQSFARLLIAGISALRAISVVVRFIEL